MNIIYYLLSIFFKEEKFNTGLMVLTSIFINILQTNSISYITAKIIDSLQKNNKTDVLNYFKYFVIISVIYIILYFLYKYFQNKLMTKLRQWMRHQLIKMLLIINNDNYNEINFTKLNSPINRISSVCFMVFTDIISYILPNITFLLMVSAYFLYKNLMFGAGFILGNLLLLLYLWLNWENMLEYNVEYENYVNETEAYLQEILNNIDKIIYRGQTVSEIDIFTEKTNNSIKHALQFYENTNFHGTIMNIIVFIILFLSISYIIVLFFKKQIDMTLFITFFTILLLYRDKMITIIQQIPDFIEFIGRSDSVLKHFTHMETELYIMNKEKPEPVELEFKQFRFENVEFKYNKRSLFENLNITLNTNDKIIGITGLSGNGKSTFAKLMLKLYKCDAGAIYIDNVDIRTVDSDYIRQNVTYVNQNSKLFDKKVVDNMLYGCIDIDQCNKHLTEIMQYDKIKELYKKMDIYDTQSGSMGENLSGGQRQVINIIGGLINPSKILILDEPTNALDLGLKREILGIIGEFKKYKQCIIIITHDRDVYPLFDETIQI
jgi:ATP-binding cassette subfamily B protein